MTNIQKYREINNLSKNKLAKIINIDRREIQLWEQEKRYPNIENSLKLAALFNANPNEFTRKKQFIIYITINQINTISSNNGQIQIGCIYENKQ